MPPATTTSALPASKVSWANMVVCMAEPHIFDRVTAPVESGKPALRKAWRAGAWPWPAIRQLPKYTCSTASGATPARSTAARMATAPRSLAVTLEKSPWKAPMGVRAAPTMTTGSCMVDLRYLGGLLGFRKQFTAYQHAADFAGAGADFIQFGVAPQAAGRVLVDVAIAAQRLDRFACHPGGFFGAVQDRAGRILAQLAHGFGCGGAVARLADGVDVGLARHHGRIHIGQFALHQLEFTDGLAELLAVMHIRHYQVHARLHDAQRTARQYGALEVQARHQHIDAFAQAAQHVFGWHFAILEYQFACVRTAHAQLVEFLRNRKTLEILFDQERRHAARARFQVILCVDTSTSASGPLVIHILVPFKTQRSPLKSARSFMLTTSEPAFGSDMARAPMCSPVISFGRYLAFCSSVPLRLIWFTHRFEWAP